MRGVFFGAICLLLASLSGGHQNQTSCVLFYFTFEFVFSLSRYSIVLLLQLHSHMTGEYSYYKEVKIKNKNTAPPNKSTCNNKSWSPRSWENVCVSMHASSPWHLSSCVKFLFSECGMETTTVFCFDISVSLQPPLPVLVASCATYDWSSVLIGSLCRGVLHALNWPPSSFQVLNRWIITSFMPRGFDFDGFSHTLSACK